MLKFSGANLFKAAICLLLFVSMACKPRGTGTPASLTLDDMAAGGKITRVVIDGVLAAPGSEARLRAAAVFEGLLAARYQAAIASPGVKHREWEQGLRLFIDYLKTPPGALAADGGVCRREERIRVYRGISGQPVLRPAGSSVTGVHLMKGWGRAIVSAFRQLKSQKTLTADFLKVEPARVPGSDGWVSGMWSGEIILDQLDLLYEHQSAAYARLENLNWDEVTQHFNWQAMAVDHTKGQQATTSSDLSANSFFISTTLNPDVAKRFGAGAFIVADICPERVMFTQIADTLDEEELLVPFFLLPEEIVRIENADCQFYLDPLGELNCEKDVNSEYEPILPPGCKKVEPAINWCDNRIKSLDLTRGEVQNTVSKHVEGCFTPEFTDPYTGGEDTGGRFSGVSRSLQKVRYLENLKVSNDAWLKARDSSDLRRFMTSAGLCAGNCPVVTAQRRYLQDGIERARREAAESLAHAEAETKEKWKQTFLDSRATALRLASYMEEMIQKLGSTCQ